MENSLFWCKTFVCPFTLWGQGTLLSGVNCPSHEPNNEFKSEERVVQLSEKDIDYFSKSLKQRCSYVSPEVMYMKQITQSLSWKMVFLTGRKTLWKDWSCYRCYTWTTNCHSAQLSLCDIALLGHPHGCAATWQATCGPFCEVVAC